MNAWALGAAARVLDTTVHVQAASLSAPAHSAADVEAGLRLYRQDCQICHGGAAAKASSIARGLYQLPPQFGDGSMADDPENETYWKIAHGIRFTGMPAFANSLSMREIWQVAAFLHEMKSLPPGARAHWEHPGVVARK